MAVNLRADGSTRACSRDQVAGAEGCACTGEKVEPIPVRNSNLPWSLASMGHTDPETCPDPGRLHRPTVFHVCRRGRDNACDKKDVSRRLLCGVQVHGMRTRWEEYVPRLVLAHQHRATKSSFLLRECSLVCRLVSITGY